VADVPGPPVSSQNFQARYEYTIGLKDGRVLVCRRARVKGRWVSLGQVSEHGSLARDDAPGTALHFDEMDLATEQIAWAARCPIRD
jgi:hypothetical protein